MAWLRCMRSPVLSKHTIFIQRAASQCRRCIATSPQPTYDPSTAASAHEDMPELQPFARVSPMDPVSNIKMIHYTLASDASPRRRQIEARRVRAQKEWVRFWTLHNRDYALKLEALKAQYPPKGEVPPDTMTHFYQEHMATTRADHRRFNAWWIGENFGMLAASFKCWFTDRIPERKEPGFFGSH
ncbi:hypothetical protein BCR37DRAFT_386705 [Protomyces lactucae-debilis]|uniref:Uncharacterized protein n=1 Tax=Protomyces lactucae-debilis TaxID=2754530 RepID=A0A1Y2FIA2_PROLT|nr:uncharacterized protein BCR37DRAFT_386705 [Protomyces lactucae-debilis]ORY83669.1 hypothetical protein BCR37DRAFT_386705 [Protomyces lactucae-debilis]